MSSGPTAVVPASSASADLVERIAAGERVAEADFVREYARGVRAMVRRRCRPNDPIVDDLVQEVLTGVIERLRAGAVRDAAALPGYVQAAVVYTTSAEYRRRRPTESVPDDIADEADPGRHTHDHQVATLLRDLLAEMTVPRDREILRRFYIDEEDKDSVCRQLGIEPEHFHRVVFRARERFRGLAEKAGLGEIR